MGQQVAQIRDRFIIIIIIIFMFLPCNNWTLLKYDQLIAPMCDTKILFTH